MDLITKSFKYLFVSLTLLSGFTSHAARNGTPVVGQFPGVAYIRGGGLAGTGVLISKDLVLTVNHVIGKATPQTLKVYFDYNPGYQNQAQEVETIRVFTSDIDQEIAIVKLKHTAPVQYYPLHTDVLKLKTRLVGVGYGMTLNPDIQKNTLNQADMIFKGYMPMGELGPGRNNQLGCPGDSGGPVFMMDNSNKAHLVGLNGHIIGNFKDDDTNEVACKKARVARFIPIRNHIEWIRQSAVLMGTSFE